MNVNGPNYPTSPSLPNEVPGSNKSQLPPDLTLALFLETGRENETTATANLLKEERVRLFGGVNGSDRLPLLKSIQNLYTSICPTKEASPKIVSFISKTPPLERSMRLDQLTSLLKGIDSSVSPIIIELLSKAPSVITDLEKLSPWDLSLLLKQITPLLKSINGEGAEGIIKVIINNLQGFESSYVMNLLITGLLNVPEAKLETTILQIVPALKYLGQMDEENSKRKGLYTLFPSSPLQTSLAEKFAQTPPGDLEHFIQSLPSIIKTNN